MSTTPEPRSEHPSVTRVKDALAAGGAARASIDGLRILPEAVTTAVAAAAAVGVEVGQIANSLVFDAGGEPVLVLTSGARRVDTGKVAALLGVPELGRAGKDFVRRATGQVIGGVAPVGHPAPLRTLVDRTLAEFDVVWAAGGVARAVFPTTFDELVTVTGGTPADVA